MMKTLTMQSLGTVAQPHTNGTKQVGNAARNGWGDQVADAIEPVTAGTVPADDAQLSLAGALVGEALKGDDVRWEKVAELRQRIAAGTYHVSSLDVAGRMIDALSL